MRAVVIEGPGGPEVLSLRRVPVPVPGPGEVLIRLSTSGVNRADLLQRAGRYPVPAGYPQDIPGLEFAGSVEALGEGVEGVGLGARVMGITGGGGYAEFVVAPVGTLVVVPASLSLDDAGAVPEVFMTAFDAIILQESLSAGETLLVHAVGSGVGTAALQLAHAVGARVVGTSRTSEKLERAALLGLDHAVPGADGWPERVLEVTDGRGVDVILDLVGGPYLAGNQRVLAERGRHIVVGVPGGADASIDLRALMGRRGSIRGTVLRARDLAEKVALASAFTEQVRPLLASGAVSPVIDRILPAEDAPEAHRAMAANENFGKILLRW